MEVFGSRLRELSFPDSGSSRHYKTCAGWFQIWGDAELPERAEARTMYSEEPKKCEDVIREGKLLVSVVRCGVWSLLPGRLSKLRLPCHWGLWLRLVTSFMKRAG